jgi:hypothetical protein
MRSLGLSHIDSQPTRVKDAAHGIAVELDEPTVYFDAPLFESEVYMASS